MSRALLANANAQAWLALIRHAEGTAKYKNPYGTAFTGAAFDNNKPHPAIVRGASGGWRSDAAGAYQFLSTTWKGIWGGRNLPMTQENQDLAALKLIQRRGVDPTQPLSRQLIAKLAPEWASLPTMAGLSYYGQPVKRFEELKKVWDGAAKNFNPQGLYQQPQQPQIQQPQQPNKSQGPDPLQNVLSIPSINMQRMSPAQLINNAVESLGIQF